MRGAIPLTPALHGCALSLEPTLSISQCFVVVCITSSSQCRGLGREKLSRVNLKDLEHPESCSSLPRRGWRSSSGNMWGPGSSLALLLIP